MGIFLLATFLAVDFAFAAIAMENTVTAAQMEKDFAARRAQFVIERYFDCQHGSGYRLVDSGDPSSVKLAATLLAHADACVTESLQTALGTAMARRPAVVLPYVNTNERLQAARICLPFISDEDSPARRQAVVARTRRALLRVHSRTLARQRAACLVEAR
ncbi:MAG: hypothetical protein JO261_04495 [Alphaproteobacteria bacterium]|nr:hypothetical protein [Alphaproteobacteria bacterium]MBV9692939.1 hypothetical protein [Alphaproteobacteria bacterium]